GPLPMVPWRESHPAFNVQSLSDSEQAVKKHFTKANVYYLGAHTGCSCGFQYGPVPPTTDEDRREEAAGRQSVASLREYLKQAVQDGREVELFSSWEGDWHEENVERMEVSPDWFSGESFRLPEKVAFRVRNSAG